MDAQENADRNHEALGSHYRYDKSVFENNPRIKSR